METDKNRERHKGWRGMSVKPHYRIFISDVRDRVSVAERERKQRFQWQVFLSFKVKTSLVLTQPSLLRALRTLRGR